MPRIALHDSIITKLIDEPLNYITVIWDYYVLGVGNFHLTVLHPSWLTRDNEKIMDTASVFLHHLRGLFGASLKAVRVVEDILQIEWSTGTVLHISFRSEDYVGPEGL